MEKDDTNFSAERNYAIIYGTIAEYEKMRYSLNEKVEKNAGNVADILSSFAKYKLDRDGGKQLEEWLGKENLGRIYGEKLLEKIRMFESIKKSNREKGNTKFENFYLT